MLEDLAKENGKIMEVPILKDVLAWQKTMGAFIGVEQLARWQKEKLGIIPSSRALESGDGKVMSFLGQGAWLLNKFTPTLSDLKTYAAIGGWCTFSEGDTDFIYKGKLPDGTKIQTPSDITDFLELAGNRFEQVLRCISPMGISQNEAMPYFIVVEDSMWAERIVQKLDKPNWKDELTQAFKSNAKQISESLIKNWLSVATGSPRSNVFFFYTSEIQPYLDEAVAELNSHLRSKDAKDILENAAVLAMYTGFWLSALKRIQKFSNKFATRTLAQNTEAIIAEVDSHFQLRGSEEVLIAPYFAKYPYGVKTGSQNDNRLMNAVAFFQPRTVNQEKRLVPNFTLPSDDVLNIGKRKLFVANLFNSLESETIYLLGNSILVEAVSSLSWNTRARNIMQQLTLIPKEGGHIDTFSGKPIDQSYTNQAKDLLGELVLILDEIYQKVGY